MADLAELQTRWKYIYQDYLPTLARARDPVQKRWPVHLDHCFARIVLDCAVGGDRPWTETVKQPAVKHMTEEQLEKAIELAQSVATGNANLVELNERSLELRGKKRKADAVSTHVSTPKRQKRGTEAISAYFLPSPSSEKPPEVPKERHGAEAESSGKPVAKDRANNVDMSIQLKRINGSEITPFRKHMLRLLCQIPPGRYSTYQALSDHVSKTSHKTCARAVGSAMRNNPFAPEVPCHRVVANDGTLGGFKGYWGEGGKFASLKHELLYEEGVRFDSRGKVKGPPFRDFTD